MLTFSLHLFLLFLCTSFSGAQFPKTEEIAKCVVMLCPLSLLESAKQKTILLWHNKATPPSFEILFLIWNIRCSLFYSAETNNQENLDLKCGLSDLWQLSSMMKLENGTTIGLYKIKLLCLSYQRENKCHHKVWSYYSCELNNQEVIRRDKNMRTAPLSKEPWEHLRVEVRCEIKWIWWSEDKIEDVRR